MIEELKSLLGVIIFLSISAACDYLTNGGFENPSLFLSNSQSTFNPQGWIGTSNIAKGFIFNKNWKTQVAQLDASINTAIKQTVILPKKGKYLLKYQYAAREQGFSTLSKLKILWNNVIVQTVICTDYNIKSNYLILNGKVGKNTISFENMGPDKFIGITFDNIQLNDYIPPSSNLIINGNFQTPKQTSSTIFNGIFGWNGIIELGVGSIYNTKWKSQVAQLDAFNNQMISQKVNIMCNGTYILKYQYAAREGKPLITSQLKVIWNGIVLEYVQPTSYNIFYNEMVVPTFIGTNVLSFLAVGPSDSFGLTIDNVGLYNKQNYCK